MSAKPASDWRDAFCGRSRELEALAQRFEEVVAGHGPKLCVLLGDRGMGKTRLVQEFYRYLSANRDPDHYWPSGAVFSGNNLRVAPDLSDPQTRAHFASFALEDRSLSYLWWGFRLADPGARNAPSAGLISHRTSLDLHLVPALFARRRSRLAQAVKHAALEHGTHLGKKAVLDVVKTIPAVGAVATIFEWSVELLERAGQTTRDARRARLEDRSEHEASLPDLYQRQTTSLLDRTLQDLSEVMERRDDLDPLPTIVFCDDAQFAMSGGDEGALRLLEQLWERAHLSGWPLLLILSHWSVEWHLRNTAQPLLNSGALRCVARSFETASRSPQYGTLLELKAEPSLGALIDGGLLGLAQTDRALLLNRAGGNPQLLVELIEAILRSPAWRTGDGLGLTRHARAQLESRTSNLVSLIQDRLESEATSERVRQCVALSSLQGDEFLQAVTLDAAVELGVLGCDDAIVAAQHPHRLITAIQEGVFGFVQPAYREAAASLIGGHLGDATSIRSVVTRSAVNLTLDHKRFDALSVYEQEVALRVVTLLGETAEDSQTRLVAARSLQRLVRMALRSERGADYALAAELAQRFEQGVADGRWSLADFPLEDIYPACNALDVWHGPNRATHLVGALQDRAREEFDRSDTFDTGATLMFWRFHNARAAEARDDWAKAEALYRENLDLARVFLVRERSPKAKRYVLLALGGVSRAAEVSCRWDEVQASCREMLKFSRELSAELQTVEAQRDLFLCLMRVGEIAQARGRSNEAAARWREGLDAAWRLAERSNSHQARADLAFALKRVGDASRIRGRLEEANSLYREALAFDRQLADQLGTINALHALADSLQLVGLVAEGLTHINVAEDFYAEGLKVSRMVSERSGAPWATRALAAVLVDLGRVRYTRGDRTASCTALAEARRLLVGVADRRMNKDSIQELADIDRQLSERGCNGLDN